MYDFHQFISVSSAYLHTVPWLNYKNETYTARVNDVVWWGFDRKCHRYLLVLFWMFHFFCRTEWKCIKWEVLGK